MHTRGGGEEQGEDQRASVGGAASPTQGWVTVDGQKGPGWAFLSGEQSLGPEDSFLVVGRVGCLW